jgi:hypothetical protein
MTPDCEFGVTSVEGGAGRAELLITIEGCHREPCSLVLNMDRAERATLEGELRTKLRDALARH